MNYSTKELETALKRHFINAKIASETAIKIHLDKAQNPPETVWERMDLTNDFIKLMEEAIQEQEQAISILKKL